MMSRLRLFRLLRQNNRLGYRRSPVFEQSLVAKVMMVIAGGIFVLYIIIFGTMFGSMAVSADEPSFAVAIMPMLLLIDFGIRFMVQQTPAMLVKPYLLLPLPRKSVVETFLITSLFSTYNWLWLCFMVPYAIIVWAGGCPLWLNVSLLLGFMLLIMTNSQYYLLVRTLVARNVLWWIFPIVVYGFYFSALLFEKNGDLFTKLCEALVDFGATPWFLPLCVVLFAVLFLLNRKMQFAFVYAEVAEPHGKTSEIRHASQYAFLDRYGVMGEYLKLELKSIFRNKAIRARVISSLVLIVVLSALIAYTDVYDGRIMLNFFCYYCFALYGVTALVKVMGPEGNYIDLLLTYRENILSLLRAKYYFHCAILVVPMLVMLPAILAGKFSWLMVLAYMFLSSGLLYFIMFQLAVYNKQTLPLDQKLTGKGNVETGLQLFLELLAMGLPVLLVALLLIAFDEDVAYTSLMVLGLILTLLHPLWLRNIYTRMMKHKYENLEGFHASR